MNVAFLSAHASFRLGHPIALHRSTFHHNAFSSLHFSQSPKEPRTLVAPRAVTTASLCHRLSALSVTIPFIMFPLTTMQPASAHPTDFQYQSHHLPSPCKTGNSTHAPIALVFPTVASTLAVTNPEMESTLAAPAQANLPKPKASSRVTLSQRFSFYMSEFLMWYPGAKVFALFVFTLVAMFLGSFLYRFADPEREEASYPFWFVSRFINFIYLFYLKCQQSSICVPSITLTDSGNFYPIFLFALAQALGTRNCKSIRG